MKGPIRAYKDFKTSMEDFDRFMQEMIAAAHAQQLRSAKRRIEMDATWGPLRFEDVRLVWEAQQST